LGGGTLADLPESVEAETQACNMCGYCVSVCPAWQEIGWESATARGKMFYLKRRADNAPLDPLNLLIRHKTDIDADFGKAMAECTACGACEEICHADIPLDGWLDSVKRFAVESNGPLMPAHAELVKTVKQTKNVYGRPQDERLASLGDDLRPSPHPEILLWFGCVGSYRHQRVAQATLQVLNAAGVRYEVLGKDEWCTGSPLLRVGESKYVEKELMPHNLQAVEKSGAKILVTACGECFRAFSVDYKRLGGHAPFQVLHVSHYVERLVKEKRLKFTKPVKRKLVFHDACHLARNAGAYDAPRKALKFVPGLEILEMYYSRETTKCCGEDLGFRAAFPVQAQSLAAKRLQEAKETGAEAIVTGDAHTEVHLNEVSKKLGRGLETFDLVEILAQAL